MNSFEFLEEEAANRSIDIIENYPFNSCNIKGLYCDGAIALNKAVDTTAERTCILAEELGHHHTTVGNILDQSDPGNRKQEYQARLWAYNRLIGLNGIVNAYRSGCRTFHDIADYLNVTESFLAEALSCYQSKYGPYQQIDNYVLYFEPLGVFKLEP